MDNKLTKSRLLYHFKDSWYKYLAMAIVCIFLSIFLFDWIATTKAWERIDIYIVCNRFYDEDLKDDVMKFLDENCEDNMIREVNVTHLSPSDSEYREQYTLNGGNNSTILVLPYSEMALTGHQVLTLVENKYLQTNGGSMYDSADTYVGEYILKDSNVRNRYFNADGSGILENLYVFDWKINEQSYNDTYYHGITGNVYGFRIDNLDRCPFEWYQYEDESSEIKYEKDANGEYIKDANGDKIPVKDKGYLVVNSHASAYTVGEYSVGKKYDDHNETFMVAGFMLERYFYGEQ